MRIKGILSKIVNQTHWFTFFIFVYCIIFLLLMHGSSIEMGDPDGFYHARVSAMMLDSFTIDFPYLVGTHLNTIYADHAFLYHVYLIPFVYFFEPVWGAFWGTLILSAGALTLLLSLIRKHDAEKIWYYVLAVTLAFPLIFRLSLLKTTGISLILMLLGAILIVRRSWVLLFFLSVLYVLTHGSFPILFVFVALFGFSQITHGGLSASNTRDIILGCLSVCAGILLGSLIHPYFPSNVDFFLMQIYEIAVKNYSGDILVGTEWYPFGMMNVFLSSLFIFVPWIVSSLYVFFEKKYSSRHIFLFCVSLFFCVLAAYKSRRHIEYFIPFALLSTSLNLAGLNISDIKMFWNEYVKPVFKNERAYTYLMRYTIVFLVMFSVGSFIMNMKALNRIPFDFGKDEMQWLQDNSMEGAIVVNTQWDEFPMMFYYNQHNYFTIGLDPVFMYKKNPEVYWLWRAVIGNTNPADLCERTSYCFERRSDLYRMLQRELGAAYLIVNQKRTPELVADIENYASDAGIRHVYDGDDLIIYSFDQI